MINRMGIQSSPGESASPRPAVVSPSLAKSVLLSRLEAEVSDHPKRALTAALSLGVLVGWIIKRR